jgi:hypothetical protein
MIYLKFICNTSGFFPSPCKTFNMHLDYLYLIYFITDATVDLLHGESICGHGECFSGHGTCIIGHGKSFHDLVNVSHGMVMSIWT